MLQKSNNKIDGVVAANDTLANAVISALQARDLDIVPVTGLDATAGAVQHILAGEQAMTVYFSIKDQATKAANLAVQIARGERPTGIDSSADNGTKEVPTIFLKPVTITKDNIADTVIADEFVSWDDAASASTRSTAPSSADGLRVRALAVHRVPRPRGVRAGAGVFRAGG